MTETPREAMPPEGMRVWIVGPSQVRVGDLFRVDGAWRPVTDMRAGQETRVRILIFQDHEPVALRPDTIVRICRRIEQTSTPALHRLARVGSSVRRGGRP
ncbi:hypothetical protein GCM10010319_69110 [Streptomyces blastmyceticus]|uniref:Uncharacterized protein n=1 Tax=Streptomyces blastmyceticus TaxID=68180 RepID=A0ABN0Y381_9ACTN